MTKKSHWKNDETVLVSQEGFHDPVLFLMPPSLMRSFGKRCKRWKSAKFSGTPVYHWLGTINNYLLWGVLRSRRLMTIPVATSIRVGMRGFCEVFLKKLFCIGQHFIHGSGCIDLELLLYIDLPNIRALYAYHVCNLFWFICEPVRVACFLWCEWKKKASGSSNNGGLTWASLAQVFLRQEMCHMGHWYLKTAKSTINFVTFKKSQLRANQLVSFHEKRLL